MNLDELLADAVKAYRPSWVPGRLLRVLHTNEPACTTQVYREWFNHRRGIRRLLREDGIPTGIEFLPYPQPENRRPLRAVESPEELIALRARFLELLAIAESEMT